MKVEKGTIASRLRCARGQLSATQEDVSEASGLSVRSIRSIEQGQRKNPQAATMARLAEALGVNLEWLVTGKGEPCANGELASHVAGVIFRRLRSARNGKKR